MNYNSLHAAGQVWGTIILGGMLVSLVLIEAWPIIALLAVMTPLVGWFERFMRPELYR